MSSKFEDIKDAVKDAANALKDTVAGGLSRKDYTTSDTNAKRQAEGVGNVVKQVAKTSAVVGVGIGAAAAAAAMGPAAIIPAAAMLNVREVLPGIAKTVSNAAGVVTDNINPMKRGAPGQFSNAPTPEKFSLLEKLTGKKLSVVELFFRKRLDVPETGDPSTMLRKLNRFASNAGAKSEDLLKQLDILKENFFNRNTEIEELMYQNNPLAKAIEVTEKFESVSKTWKFVADGEPAEKTLIQLHEDSVEAADTVLFAMEPIDNLAQERQEAFGKLQEVMGNELGKLKQGFFELSVDEMRDTLQSAHQAINIHLGKVEQKQLDKIDETFAKPEFIEAMKDLGVKTPEQLAAKKVELQDEVRKQMAAAKKEIDDNFNRRVEALACCMTVAAHDIRGLAHQRNEVLDAFFDGMDNTPFTLEASIGQDPVTALKRLNPNVDPNNLSYQQTQSGTTFRYNPESNSVQVGWGMKTSQRDKVNDLENMIGRIYSKQVKDLMKQAASGEINPETGEPLQFKDIPGQTSLQFNVYAPTKKEARMLAESVAEIACLKGIPMKNLEISYTVGDEQEKIPLDLMTVEEAPLRSKIQKMMQDRTASVSKANVDGAQKMVEYKREMFEAFTQIDPNDPRVSGPAVGMAAPAL